MKNRENNATKRKGLLRQLTVRIPFRMNILMLSNILKMSRVM